MAISIRLCFASKNANKINEIKKLLDNSIELVTLEDIGCEEDIPETGSSIEENARLKALFVQQYYGFDCFADDSGLQVDALGGQPGVYSARYAGEPSNSQNNITLLLKNMEGIADRSARFLTVIALMLEKETFVFEGKVEGIITGKRMGAAGFGYDPVFIPDGYSSTFAEMSLQEKNAISHRGKAILLLTEFLHTRVK